MIGYIKGTVEDIQADSIILEKNGIGFRIYTSKLAMESFLHAKNEVKMYTYMNVREDDISLYGFPTKEELDTFQLLLTVNGIGPKAALSVLSFLSVADLTYAVMSGDTKAITRANGIGVKGANRIIMELRDKLKLEEIPGNTDVHITDTNQAGDSISDTILALVSLGYSESEARNAIMRIEHAGDMDSETLLKNALKQIF